MIKKDGDYYIYQQQEQQRKQQLIKPNPQKKSQTFQAVGDSRERIKLIRQRFEMLKIAKKSSIECQSKQGTMLDIITPQYIIEQKIIEIQMSIPQEILKLQARVNKIKQMVRANQISKQKIEKKANISDRIRSLLTKFKVFNQTSSQIIFKNIQNYSNYIDDQPQLLKINFLYDAFTKTQGLDQQISVINDYLKKLSIIHTKFNSMVDVQKLVKDHNNILKKRQQLSQKIEQLFISMKKDYQEVIGQIQKLTK